MLTFLEKFNPIKGLEEPDLPDLKLEESQALLNDDVTVPRAKRPPGLNLTGLRTEETDFQPDHDLPWTELLQQQCPYLKKLILDKDGSINPDQLEQVMRKLKLNPCGSQDKDRGECLQRNCAILWRYYIQKKHGRNTRWKRCGNTLVDADHYTGECSEARAIADHMFNERDTFSYRPGDIAFLYEVAKIENADPGKFGTLHKITKKRGDAVLKINHKVHPGTIRGHNIVRFVLVNEQSMHDYFVALYALEVGTSENQPHKRKSQTSNMYALMESMDGSLTSFQRHFQKRDPYYWNRLQRMLIHALRGLYQFNQRGFSHNDVKKENLLYKLDWEHNLVAVKWADYDCVAELGEKPTCTSIRIDDPLQYPHDGTTQPDFTQHDRFAFGILVYELLFSTHPAGDTKTVDATWKGTYNQVGGKESHQLHHNIRQLLQPNPLQPLSTAAYHFIVNEKLFPDEPRWDYAQAFNHIKSHPLEKEQLPPLPQVGELPPLPRPYLDW